MRVNMDKIEITKSNYGDYVPLDIMAFSFASPGASDKFIIIGVIICMMAMVSCKDKTVVSNPPETASQQAEMDVANDSIIYPMMTDSSVVGEKHSDGSKIDENMTETTPAGLKRIMECIAKGDAKTLASLTSYPIRLRYPLKNIANKKQMIALFNTLFDKPFRNRLRRAKVEDWSEVGWHGFYYDRGELWVSSDKLYTVNYQSDQLKALRENLVKKEMKSLHESLQRDGWKPYQCFRDQSDGSIIRIDKRGEKYRLALFRKNSALAGEPDVCSVGTLDIQGTMQIEWFTFPLNNHRSYILSDDRWGDVSLILVVDEDWQDSHQLEYCYWLDLIP